MKKYFSYYQKTFDFNSKSNLVDFVFFVGVNFLISVLLITTKKLHGIEHVEWYFRYIYFLPFLSLGFRRLNDVGFNKWLFLVPLVNFILALFPTDYHKK